jgi:hypothetical protein
MTDETEHKTKKRVLRATIFSVAIVAALAIMVIGLEAYINPDSSREKKDFVQTMAQIVGGTALLLGLYFTWRTLRLNQEGQVTDRFTKAIDQLGATDDKDTKQLEVRLGGIYALARIARDSPADHWPIVQIWTAYVRQHARWKTEETSQPSYIPPRIRARTKSPVTRGLTHDNVPSPAPDVQAVLSVLGRRTRYYENGERGRIDLRDTDLRGADLSNARLQGADLRGAHLEGANLREANLGKADLRYAHLEGAFLQHADLKDAILQHADLKGADLRHANLGAFLWNADLTGTVLPYTDLRESGFHEDEIKWAAGDETTRLPSELHPHQRPFWWKTSPGSKLVPAQTYHVGSFKPALSFSVEEGWRTGFVRAFDHLTFEHKPRLDLSFHNVWGVYDPENPNFVKFEDTMFRLASY